MSKQAFMRAMNHIDDQTLERYETAKKRFTDQKRRWIPWTAAAACLVLILSVASILLIPPIQNTSPYSAQQIADLFPSTESMGGTNAYQKIYVSDDRYLYLNELPDQKYLPVYSYRSSSAKLNISQFERLLQPFSSRLPHALGVGDLPFEISESFSQAFSEDSLIAEGKNEQYHFYAEQFANHHRIYFSKNYDLSPEIVLNGETVQIDQRQTDEQIIASLSGIKQSLFEIFGKSFTHAKVVRDFDSYSEYGASSIFIYFYNESDNALNPVMETPVSDYIMIWFNNDPDRADEHGSDSILCDTTIYYYNARTNRNPYKTTARVKRISLEEAEALLYKGYVFGGHTCPLCMQEQEKVDFEDYNYVSFTYVFGKEKSFPRYPTVGIPFYVFYKQIGTARNGNKIYAKTYVPAIAIDGLEEYFEAQQKDHKS